MIDLSGFELKGKDLAGADLSGAQLTGTLLDGANLANSNLTDANLAASSLRGAYLNNAHLSGTNLKDADLRGADLQGVDLRGATLQSTDLRGANLGGANLEGAEIEDSDFAGVQCVDATWPRGYEAPPQESRGQRDSDQELPLTDPEVLLRLAKNSTEFLKALRRNLDDENLPIDTGDLARLIHYLTESRYSSDECRKVIYPELYNRLAEAEDHQSVLPPGFSAQTTMYRSRRGLDREGLASFVREHASTFLPADPETGERLTSLESELRLLLQCFRIEPRWGHLAQYGIEDSDFCDEVTDEQRVVITRID